MSRVILADDSPHAQRMGEFILREDGFEIVSVTDGATAVVRLADVDPDLVLADVNLPQRSGYELCRYIKNHPNYRHVRVVLTAGALVPISEEQAREVSADGWLHKPFEASVMVELAQRLAKDAQSARLSPPEPAGAAEVAPAEAADAAVAAVPSVETVEVQPTIEVAPEDASAPVPVEPAADVLTPVEVAALEGVAEDQAPADEVSAETIAPAPAPPRADPQAVLAAVTLALETALPVLIDEITQRVLLAFEEEPPTMQV